MMSQQIYLTDLPVLLLQITDFITEKKNVILNNDYADIFQRTARNYSKGY